jgi:23S rRNA pseudouridine2605 synthase
MTDTPRQSQATVLPADQPVRIARCLAAAGIAARRKCEELVTAGRVTVNGITVTTPATNVRPGKDRVCVDGQPVAPARRVVLLLHKPPGFTCSAEDAHAERLVTELLPKDAGRLFTIGRLDRDSEGLLLCTNDGELAERLAHPRYEVAKVYRVEVAGPVTPVVPRRMLEGVTDDGERLHAAEARIVTSSPAKSVLELVLKEGKKREIRRLCDHLRLKVRCLRRIAYGPLRLAGLPPGAWREVSAQELAQLQQSSKPDTGPAGKPRAG